MKAIIYASTEYWPLATKFATSWVFLEGLLNRWRQVDLCDFERQESICTRVKHNAELFLQFVRLLYSTFTKTVLKSNNTLSKTTYCDKGTIVTHFQAKIRQILKFSIAIKFRTCKGHLSFAALKF